MVRARHIVVSLCMVLGAIGCNRPEKEPPAQDPVKIGDLAPSHPDTQSGAQLLKTINFGLHMFDIPAENISKLNDFWPVLDTKPLRFNNARAFKANSFLVGFAPIQLWDKVHELLLAAGGQKIGTVSLFLADSQANDLAITGLDREHSISFVGGELLSQRASVGPGILALRIKAAKVPGVRGACTVIAHPVFTLPTASPVPELAARQRVREFPFISTAFGLKMSPGDFIVLGPENYVGDFSTLSSVFFCKPEGSVFFRAVERKPPERKPAIRIFLLVCVRIND